MPLVCEQGAASEALMPYDQYDCVSWPSEAAYYEAIPYRCRDWAWLRTRNETELANVKQILANGSTCVIAIWCWDNFMNISRYNNTYCVADRAGQNGGGHGVCIVGYDDTLTTRDGRGAFRIVNSWGTGWGDRGYFWMSYQAVMNTDLSQRVVGYLMDTVGYQPRLFARVRLNHPTRDRIALQFLVGRASSPQWYREFRTWRQAAVDQPFPPNNIVFDLTEASEYLTGQTAESVYFCCWDTRLDGRDGAVEQMGSKYLPWYNWYPSTTVPTAIPDNGGMVLVGTRVEQHARDASVATVLAPLGVVEPGQAYRPQARVYNYGTTIASFLVYLRIGADWRDSRDVNGLAPGESSDVEFGYWTAPPEGVAVLSCSTALAGDSYHANDTVSATVRVRYHDVAVVEVLAPGPRVDSGVGLMPRVRCRNNGTQTETFLLRFVIPGESYNRLAQLGLAPGAEGQALFPTWTPRVLGSHAYTCSLSLSSDQNPENNRIEGTVEVVAGSGIAELAGTKSGSGLVEATPNPFSTSTVIRYSLARPGPAVVRIGDVTGRIVFTRALDHSSAGAVVLDGRSLPAGTYLVRLESRGQTATAVVVRR